jgi:hypothetical protein
MEALKDFQHMLADIAPFCDLKEVRNLNGGGGPGERN